MGKKVVDAPRGCFWSAKARLVINLLRRLGIRGRWLVLVHRDGLAQQAKDKLQRWNPDLSVGIEMGQSRADHEDIVCCICSNGRTGRLRENSAVCSRGLCRNHYRRVSSQHSGVLPKCTHSFRTGLPGSKRLLLGVTATHIRGDGQATDGSLWKVTR
jgi:hypothetical protein